MDFAFDSAVELAARIRRRKISCVDLLEHYLDRVRRYNGDLTAVCVFDLASAKKRARAADKAIAKGDALGPLHGVPMTVKESFDVAGLPTTWGRPEMQKNIASRNAVAVDRLLAAGANVFGKTNVPVMLADWQTFNPVYGTTSNPWDHTRVPGGSSGGAAAALAAGLTGLEIGSDIGASIRDPAHYCGVYGHKPTYAVCASDGHRLPPFDTPNDIGVIGPLARSAKDLEVALAAIVGTAGEDSVGWQVTLPPAPRKTWKQWRVAVITTAPTAPVDRAVQARIQAVAEFAASRGAKVSDKARPDIPLAEAHRVFIHLLRSATSRSMTDEAFDRFATRAKRVDPAKTDYVSWMLTGCTLSHREWLLLDEARHRMMNAWADFFRDWDVLLCPAAATTAFPHNQKGERWERYGHGERQAAAVDDSDVLGRVLRASASAIDRRARGPRP